MPQVTFYLRPLPHDRVAAPSARRLVQAFDRGTEVHFSTLHWERRAIAVGSGLCLAWAVAAGLVALRYRLALLGLGATPLGIGLTLWAAHRTDRELIDHAAVQWSTEVGRWCEEPKHTIPHLVDGWDTTAFQANLSRASKRFHLQATDMGPALDEIAKRQGEGFRYVLMDPSLIEAWAAAPNALAFAQQVKVFWNEEKGKRMIPVDHSGHNLSLAPLQARFHP